MTGFTEENDLDQLGLPFDEQSAASLTAIFNNGVEEALATLSPAQLLQLEKNVKKLKMQSKGASAVHKPKEHPLMGNAVPFSVHNSRAGSGRQYHHNDLQMSNDALLDMQVNEQMSRSSNGGAARSHSTSAAAMPRGNVMGNGISHSTNLPATCPILEIRDGIEYLVFTYPSNRQLQEFCIKTNIDNISADEIPEDFKAENCVYPRAFCAKDQYTGNRWEYETDCNDLAWKLTWLNSEILAGKRGLIQRAVDSYRNKLTDMRSRRVVRLEKLTNGTLRKRTSEVGLMGSGSGMVAADHHPYLSAIDKNQKMRQITVPYTTKGATAKMRVRIDIETVNDAEVDDAFKRENSIYPDIDSTDATGAVRDYEMESNTIAWKLAYLNPSKLSGKKNLLQKAVDCFRNYSDQQHMANMRNRKMMRADAMGGQYMPNDHMAVSPYLTDRDLGNFETQKQEEFSAMVANTLQQALSHHDLSSHDLSSVVGGLELNEHDASVYESFHPHLYSTSGSGFYH